MTDMETAMIRALAAINDALGMPQDGCNSTAATLNAIALLHAIHRDDSAEIKRLDAGWQSANLDNLVLSTALQTYAEEAAKLIRQRDELLALLKVASEVIGRFVSDEGWKQSDMDCMDTIDAAITRATQSTTKEPA